MAIKTINLALQGGGAHGAYSWGVLDRLLEEDDLIIEAISGTSAGAMNAAVMVNGYLGGGRDGARAKLEEFWRKISDAAAFSPLNTNPMQRFLFGWNLDYSPAYHWLDAFNHFISPYDINPLGLNPIKYVLESVLDLDALRACTMMKLFVTATHVESGQARVFDCNEMSVEVLLASACLPQVFPAVEVEGEYYWDGGYMGNPAIWPLIYHSQCADMVLVQINPIHRDGVPRKSVDITNRINEINFNSSLIAEMRAIDFVHRLIAEGSLEEGRYKDVKMHLIYSPEEFRSLNPSSKLNADWRFFTYLRDAGRQAAEEWLKSHKKDIGLRSTVNIRDKFLCGPPGRVFHQHSTQHQQAKKKA